MTMQFENFIPELVRWIKSHLASRQSLTNFFHNQAINILSNLALRANMRQSIIAQNGIDIFVSVIEGKHPDYTGNTAAHRVAAKGLMNLAMGKKEIKHVIIGQLSGVIDEMVVNEARTDQVVASYLNALIRGTN